MWNLRRATSRLTVALIVLAGAAAALMVWMTRPPHRVVVTTAPLTTGSIIREVVATGTVQPIMTVEVGAQVSGVVAQLDADYDSVVRKGQVVAHIEPSIYAAQLQEARGALTGAEADLAGFNTGVEDAATKFHRAEVLAGRQLLPPAELDLSAATLEQARAARNAAEAAVAQARSVVTQAEVNLDHTIIRAPVDGIVIDRRVDVGQTLASSMQTPVLFTIASDLHQVDVAVDVDESDVGALAPGEEAVFKVDAHPDEIFHGLVDQIRLQPVAGQPLLDPRAASTPVVPAALTPGAASAAAATSTAGSAASSAAAAPASGTGAAVSYTAIVRVSNPQQHLLPGMTAVVTIDGLHRDNAVRIPNRALAFSPSTEILTALKENEGWLTAAPNLAQRDWRRVWTYDGHRLMPVLVRAGLADEGWTELAGGPLHPGDLLVTEATLLDQPSQ